MITLMLLMAVVGGWGNGVWWEHRPVPPEGCMWKQDQRANCEMNWDVNHGETVEECMKWYKQICEEPTR